MTLPFERPLGVTLIALGCFLGALAVLILLLLALSGFLAKGNLTESKSLLALGVLFLAMLYFLALGIGTWKCLSWAWWLTLVSCAVDLLSGFLKWNEVVTGERLFDFILSAVVFAYLMRLKIRRAFGIRFISSP